MEWTRRSHREYHWFIANKGCALVQDSFRVDYTRAGKTRRSKIGIFKKASIEAYAKSGVSLLQ